jgi:hypothetical protein
MPARTQGSGAALAFTTLMALFVLAPMLFAFGALAAEGHAVLLALADADRSSAFALSCVQKPGVDGSGRLLRHEPL